MPRLSRFLCPSCGKQLPEDPLDPGRRPACPDCGKTAQLWEKAESVVAPLTLPPLPPPTPPPRRVLGPRAWALAGLVILLPAAALLAWRVEAARRADEAERREADRRAAALAADQVVAARVDAAKARIAHQEFDEAVKILEGALATDNATRLDDARLALLQARQGKADLLLDGAVAAVARRDPAHARRLLNDYLANSYAARKPRATLLLTELGRATDEEAAARLLARLSDEELAAFADGGRLADAEPITDDGVRALYLDNLRQRLAKEQETRAARRAAALAEERRRQRQQADRDERLRADPVFVELTAFAAGVRKQYRDQARQRAREERALELFLRSTNTNDPAEREKARQALRDDDGPDFALLVVRKKAQAKQDFRRRGGHEPGDEEVFDRLVDEELGRLLAEVKEGNPQDGGGPR